MRVPGDHDGELSLADLDHGEWREEAGCRNEDDSWWFARPASQRHRVALSICESCPVRRECLAVSLVYAEEFGLWGGLSSHLRPQLVARLRAGAALYDLLDQVIDGEPAAAPGDAGEVA